MKNSKSIYGYWTTAVKVDCGNAGCYYMGIYDNRQLNARFESAEDVLAYVTKCLETNKRPK